MSIFHILCCYVALWIIVIILCFIGPSVHDSIQMRYTEVDSDTLWRMGELAKREPRILPYIKDAMADGMVSEHEWHWTILAGMEEIEEQDEIEEKRLKEMVDIGRRSQHYKELKTLIQEDKE